MQHKLRKMLLLPSIIGLVGALSSPASASDAIDTSFILAKTCDKSQVLETTPSSEIRRRFFFFILADSGMSVARDNELSRVSSAYTSRSSDSEKEIANKIAQLQAEIGANKSKVLKVMSADGSPVVGSGLGRWILDNTLTFTCKFLPKSGLGATALNFRLRSKPEDLVKAGKSDLKAVESAKVGLVTERITKDDGTTKRDTTVTIKAVIGVPIFTPKNSNSVYLYQGYELERVRSNPSPNITPPATQRDDDTEILKFGLFGHTRTKVKENADSGEETKLAVGLNLDVGYLFDLVDNSERIRIAVEANPYAFVDLGVGRTRGLFGLCGVGELLDKQHSLIPGLQGKCKFSALYQINHVTNKGNVKLKAKDEFILAGGAAKVDFQFGDDEESGFFAGMDYQYQQRLHGNKKLPSIDRFYAYLKYRKWIGNVALDYGFNFVDGINPDSFVDENKLELSFGVLF